MAMKIDQTYDPATSRCTITVDGRPPSGSIQITRTIQEPWVRVWIDGEEVGDVELYVNGVLEAVVPPAPEFVVEDVFEISGRGPCIVRSHDAAKAAFAAGELVHVGATLVCGSLKATVVGIERRPVANPGAQPQQSLLLGGIDRSDLAIGQAWRSFPVCPPVMRRLT